MSKATRSPSGFKNAAPILAAIESKDVANVVAALDACSELGSLAGAILCCYPIGGVYYSAPSVAEWLLKRAESSSAQAAVDQLATITLRREVTVDLIAIVYGVRVGATIDLGDGFRIEKFDASTTRAELLPETVSWKDTYPHETRLVQRRSVPVYRSGEPSSEEADFRLGRDRRNAIDEVLGVLSLVLQQYVAHGFLCADRLDSFWPESLGNEEVGHLRIPGIVEASASQMELVRSLLEHLRKSPRRDAVRVALTRYRSALSPWDVQQTAVDIAIAFEGLLIAEKDKDEAIARSLAQRGSWILEPDDPEGRFRTYRELKQLYGIRSDLVHTGGRAWNTKAYAAIQESEALVLLSRVRFAELAKRLLEQGFPDNWDRLVLGAPDDAAASPDAAP